MNYRENIIICFYSKSIFEIFLFSNTFTLIFIGSVKEKSINSITIRTQKKKQHWTWTVFVKVVNLDWYVKEQRVLRREVLVYLCHRKVLGFVNRSTEAGELSPPRKINIVMAFYQNILKYEFLIIGNSPLRSSCPTSNALNEFTKHSFSTYKLKKKKKKKKKLATLVLLNAQKYFQYSFHTLTSFM